MERAFAVADDILRQGVVGISEIIVRPGIINVDFTDVCSVMGDAGSALMGISSVASKGRAALAVSRAISSPLLDASIKRTTVIVFNAIGVSDMSLKEIQDAADLIYDSVDVDEN